MATPRRAPGRASQPSSRPAGIAAPLLGCGVILVVMAVVVFAVFQWVRQHRPAAQVIIPSNQCVATVGGVTATLTPEQSKYAAVIVAESIRRGLPARAATIALATAMQESALRNLDHGDRDSIGLFQQRPSQGWGTVAQIMDPWYSSGKFYDHLVKVSGWQTGDINDVAQKVQKSGVPDGYRKHVDEAKVLASTLTGNSPGALTCLNNDSPETPSPLMVTKIFSTGLAGKVTLKRSGEQWTITAATPTLMWAGVALTMATIDETPVTSVRTGTLSWNSETKSIPTWANVTPSAGASGSSANTTAVLTVTQSTSTPTASNS